MAPPTARSLDSTRQRLLQSPREEPWEAVVPMYEPRTYLTNDKNTDTTFAIGWKGRYRIEGAAFVYSDNDSGRVTTILGYPTDQLARIG